MLGAMRAGTYAVEADGADRSARAHVAGRARRPGSPQKSAGGVGVSSPNNAGGVGDRSGVIMLDRIVNRRHVRPRDAANALALEPRALVERGEEDRTVAGPLRC